MLGLLCFVSSPHPHECFWPLGQSTRPVLPIRSPVCLIVHIPTCAGGESAPEQPKAAKRRKVVGGSAAAGGKQPAAAAAPSKGSSSSSSSVAAAAAALPKKKWQGGLELGGPERRPRKSTAEAAGIAWTQAATGANEKVPMDPWAATGDGSEAQVNELGFFVKTGAKEQPTRHAKMLREKPRLRSERRAADRQAPLEPAHAGSSFNPGEEERAELLQIAGARLAEEEDRKRRVDAALRRGPSNMREVLAEWDRQSGRLPQEEGSVESEADGNEEATTPVDAKGGQQQQKQAATKQQKQQELEDSGDDPDDSWAGPSSGAPEAKSRRQRKKEKGHRQRLVEAALRRREKKAEKQLERAHIIAKEVGKEEKRQQTLAAERKAMLEARPELTPNLGTHTYQDIFPEVLLDDELDQGSLLQVKPSAHALRAQFKRFEKRALIEPISRATVSQEFSGTSYFRDKVRRRPGNNLKVINRK